MAPPFNLAYSAPNPSSAGAAATGNTSGGSGSSNVAAGVAANTSAEHAGRRGQQSPHQTPVLITHGTADAAVPRSVVERSVHFLRGVPRMGGVQLISLPGKGHGMVEGKTEMGELMRFWSRHLSRRPTAQGELPPKLRHRRGLALHAPAFEAGEGLALAGELWRTDPAA